MRVPDVQRDERTPSGCTLRVAADSTTAHTGGMSTADGGWLTWREAWDRALYGRDGFYHRQRPSDHFRTSVHASPLFARAIVTLVRRRRLNHLIDYGAGGGELLSHVRALAPELALTGVDLRARPPDLPAGITWLRRLPDRLNGVVIANELLDNVPCDVVELDDHHIVRVVEVQPVGGAERLGEPAASESLDWLERWWPLDRPGQRAAIGLPRDRVWSAACRRVHHGVALLVDYGHRRDSRPPTGTLASYRNGRQTPVRLDGRHDVTAHVAIDSVAAAVGGELNTQREMLHRLAVVANRPAPATVANEPGGYLRALAEAGAAMELTAQPGLGDFWWLLTTIDPLRRLGPSLSG